MLYIVINNDFLFGNTMRIVHTIIVCRKAKTMIIYNIVPRTIIVHHFKTTLLIKPKIVTITALNIDKELLALVLYNLIMSNILATLGWNNLVKQNSFHFFSVFYSLTILSQIVPKLIIYTKNIKNFFDFIIGKFSKAT